MNSISAYQSGLTGIRTGMASLNKHSQEIANANGSPAELIEPVVGLLSDKQQVQASSKVIEAQTSMLGTILDIKV